MKQLLSGSIDYASAGALTSLQEFSKKELVKQDDDPVDVCFSVHSLVIQPNEAKSLGLPDDRFSENQIRPAAKLVRTILGMDPAPLWRPRTPEKRVVGTCRHFAVIGCALLRSCGIPARARCGFATYFQPGKGLDHWITEYWDKKDARWIRIDPEILGGSVVDRPQDLGREQFLSGPEAWIAYRQGKIDASTYGVYGTNNWGPSEIRGNCVRDLAALNKVEMLPWDEWGKMTLAYEGKTGAEYDGLLDRISEACAENDLVAIEKLYATDELQVPPNMIH